MALITVEGFFRDGKIELAEQPRGVDGEARVLVTFLPVASQPDREFDLDAQARRAAGRRLIDRLGAGIPFGGPPYSKREELYDRAYQYDQRDG